MSKTSKIDAEGRVVVTDPPQKPPMMDPETEEIWDRILDVLPDGVITSADERAFLSYCELHAEIAMLAKACKDEPLVTNATGTKVRNPLWVQLKDSRHMLLQLSKQLGLTPRSRQEIQVASEGETKNKFEFTAVSAGEITPGDFDFEDDDEGDE